MLRELVMSVATFLVLITYAVAGDEKGKMSVLADAVKEFNRRAEKDVTGKDRP